jgi:transcriptional regulator with XRE-family HTH domain
VCPVSVTIHNVSIQTPDETARELAHRVKSLRLMQGFKRETLAHRAGVTAASLKRFETIGKGSLELLLKVVFALGRLDEFADLLQPSPARSMAEMERQSKRALPKRGRR